MRQLNLFCEHWVACDLEREGETNRHRHSVTKIGEGVCFENTTTTGATGCEDNDVAPYNF